MERAWVGWVRLLGERWRDLVESGEADGEGIACMARTAAHAKELALGTGRVVSWVVLPAAESPHFGGQLGQVWVDPDDDP